MSSIVAFQDARTTTKAGNESLDGGLPSSELRGTGMALTQ